MGAGRRATGAVWYAYGQPGVIFHRSRLPIPSEPSCNGEAVGQSSRHIVAALMPKILCGLMCERMQNASDGKEGWLC
jgi:hypothetical protein